MGIPFVFQESELGKTNQPAVEKLLAGQQTEQDDYRRRFSHSYSSQRIYLKYFKFVSSYLSRFVHSAQCEQFVCLKCNPMISELIIRWGDTFSGLSGETLHKIKSTLPVIIMTLIFTLSELNQSVKQSASIRLKSVLYVTMSYCSCGQC
jgi:hypothetical protein